VDQSGDHHILVQIVVVEVLRLYATLLPKEAALQFVVGVDKSSRPFAAA
jgi:hypothetical protein